jgi:hypothetical protein
MCFSTQLNRLLWSNISLSPPLNLWFAWSTSFKLIQLSQGNNALESPDSNTDDVLSRDTCVPLVCRSIFLFGAKGGYLHLESCDWLEIFLSTLNKLSQGNNTLDASAANIDGFIGEIHVFLQLCWIGSSGKKWAFLQLEMYVLQEIFLSQTTWTHRKSCARCCSI